MRYIISTKFNGFEHFWCCDNKFACMAFTAPIKRFTAKHWAIKKCIKLSHQYATSDFSVWAIPNDCEDINTKNLVKVYNIEKA